MASIVYGQCKVVFATGCDWSAAGERFGVLLATSEYQPAITHRHVSDVDGELTGRGYKRRPLKGRSVWSTTTGADCCADATVFPNLKTKESYKWAIIYRERADDDPDLIAACDMGHVDLSDSNEHTLFWDGQEKNGRVFSLQ
jgi:hypothetical protein